jgi:hypothetical protein
MRHVPRNADAVILQIEVQYSKDNKRKVWNVGNNT